MTLKISVRKNSRAFKGSKKLKMKIYNENRKISSGRPIHRGIIETSKEYASQTTIHGIAYVESSRGVERFLWFVVVVAAIAFTGFQTYRLYTDWQNEPVVTTLDTIAMPIKDIRFPAVTICPQGTISSALDAVLLKQLREYITNKTSSTPSRSKRSLLERFDINITEDLLRAFLKDIYPGAKKKPTKLIKVMMSEDPESTIENVAVILPSLDEEECGDTSVDEYDQAVRTSYKATCPDGFSMYRDLYCVKNSSDLMNFKDATEFCNSHFSSTLLSLDSETDLNALKEMIERLGQDLHQKNDGK